MKKAITFIFFFFLIGCNQSFEQTTPTVVVSPSLHIEQTITPVMIDIAITHPELEVITPENVQQIELISTLGKGIIYGVEISPDGSTIAVGTNTGVYLYDRFTAEQIGFINIPIAPTVTVQDQECNLQEENIAFSPNGEYLAIVDKDIKIWSLRENILYKIIPNGVAEPDSTITKIEFNMNGDRLVALHKNSNGYPCYIGWRSFVIYDVTNEKKLLQKDFSASDESPYNFNITEENFVIFSIFSGQGLEISSINLMNGKLINQELMDSRSILRVEHNFYYSYESGESGEMKTHLFDFKAKKEIRSITGYAIILPVNNFVLINKESYILETINGDSICSFPKFKETSHFYRLNSFSADGKIGVSWDYNLGEIRIWDFTTCKLSEPILYFQENGRKLKFSPDGKSLLTNNRGGYGYYIFDTQTGDFRYTVQPEDITIYKVYDVEFSAGGKNTAVYTENSIEEYDIITGSFVRKIINLDRGFLGGFIQFSPDGSKYFYNDRSSIALRYSFDNKRIIQDDINTGSFISYDGNTLVMFPYVKGGTEIRFLNLNKIWEIKKIGFIPNRYYELVFNRDLSYVAYVEDGHVYLWNTDGLYIEKILTTNLPYEQKVSNIKLFSPDSGLLIGVTYNPDEIVFWDVETGEFIHHIPTTETRNELGFLVEMSPDGRLLATLGNDGIVYIWGVRKIK